MDSNNQSESKIEPDFSSEETLLATDPQLYIRFQHLKDKKSLTEFAIEYKETNSRVRQVEVPVNTHVSIAGEKSHNSFVRTKF